MLYTVNFINFFKAFTTCKAMEFLSTTHNFGESYIKGGKNAIHIRKYRRAKSI